MDLTLVVPYYAPAWAFGGPPKVMSEEAAALSARGHAVTVMTTDAFEVDRRYPEPGLRTENGISVHRFPNISNRAAFERYRFQPRGMRRALSEIRSDAVHLSELRHELAILAWRHCRRRDVPLFVSAHGTLPRRSGPKSIVRRGYDAMWVSPMIEGAAGLIAQTSHEADLYCAYGAPPDRVHVVPLGVDQPPRAEAGVDLGVEPGRRVVLFLGRIHALKGVDRLIRGFARVADRHRDTDLVIAGRDDGGLADAQRLAAQLGVSERVAFPGPVYGEARYELYRRADLFAITPVHYEETSLASLEAASVGTPVLTSVEAEIPGLDAAGAGMTVDAHPTDPAEALDVLLGGDLPAMGRSAAALVEREHAWPSVAQRLETLFAT